MLINADQIQRLIPHRPPALIIDAVDVLVPGEQGSGHCSLSNHSHVFNGHFPAYPVMPGVLIIETVAQTTAVVFASMGLSSHETKLPSQENKSLYLARIEKARFLNPVLPDHVLRIDITLIKRLGKVAKISGKVLTVGNEDEQLVADTQLVLSG